MKRSIESKDFIDCFLGENGYLEFMEDLEIAARSCLTDKSESEMQGDELYSLQVAKMSCLMAFLMRNRKILNNLQEILMFSESEANWYMKFIKDGIRGEEE